MASAGERLPSMCRRNAGMGSTLAGAPESAGSQLSPFRGMKRLRELGALARFGDRLCDPPRVDRDLAQHPADRIRVADEVHAGRVRMRLRAVHDWPSLLWLEDP